MPEAPSQEFEVLLDRCIDALLAGSDWRPLVAPDDPRRGELVALMQVAQEIRGALDVALLTDGVRPAPTRKIWDRISGLFLVRESGLMAIARETAPDAIGVSAIRGAPALSSV